jgi:hypothetical protein
MMLSDNKWLLRSEDGLIDLLRGGDVDRAARTGTRRAEHVAHAHPGTGGVVSGDVVLLDQRELTPDTRETTLPDPDVGGAANLPQGGEA